MLTVKSVRLGEVGLSIKKPVKVGITIEHTDLVCLTRKVNGTSLVTKVVCSAKVASTRAFAERKTTNQDSNEWFEVSFATEAIVNDSQSYLKGEGDAAKVDSWFASGRHHAITHVFVECKDSFLVTRIETWFLQAILLVFRSVDLSLRPHFFSA